MLDMRLMRYLRTIDYNGKPYYHVFSENDEEYTWYVLDVPGSDPTYWGRYGHVSKNNMFVGHITEFEYSKLMDLLKKEGVV